MQCSALCLLRAGVMSLCEWSAETRYRSAMRSSLSLTHSGTARRSRPPGRSAFAKTTTGCLAREPWPENAEAISRVFLVSAICPFGILRASCIVPWPVHESLRGGRMVQGRSSGLRHGWPKGLCCCAPAKLSNSACDERSRCGRAPSGRGDPLLDPAFRESDKPVKSVGRWVSTACSEAIGCAMS